MNTSKAILIIVFVLILILIFFAITGVDVRNPEKAAITLIEKLADLNRAINRAVRNFIFSIRSSFQERFSR